MQKQVDELNFQSTLPRGSDLEFTRCIGIPCSFQSTLPRGSDTALPRFYIGLSSFQSTLPRGSDKLTALNIIKSFLSFQSTLPRGSDRHCIREICNYLFFNPRSLAGATSVQYTSVAAPLFFNPRSLAGATLLCHLITNMVIFQSTLPRGSDAPFCHAKKNACIFQSTLPRGSDCINRCNSQTRNFSIHAPSRERHVALKNITSDNFFSIHAPSRERQHQNKLLLYSFKSSIFCELAQLKYSKIYFDVRKLIVSHSSLSCEPKLNFMFHITSHRIILHYFYSCQSICK